MQDVAREAIREYIEHHSRRELTLPELLHVAERTLRADFIVRDHGLLEAALARPQATVFGKDAYPMLDGKAAALLHSLARNHALIDGNKRLALAALIAFYGLNGRRLTLTDEQQRCELMVPTRPGGHSISPLSAPAE
jgi:death-on-curing protein